MIFALPPRRHLTGELDAMKVTQHLSGASALLDATNAVSNGRALLLYLLTMITTVLLVGLMAMTGSMVMMFFGALLGAVIIFYGINAVGIQLMDAAHGGPSRPLTAAIMSSLTSSHRLILIALMTAAAMIVLTIVVSIVLLICKIPALGTMLYTFAFPLTALAMGIAYMVTSVVIYPLSATAVWDGRSVLGTWKLLLAIARKRLLAVVTQEILLFLLVALIGGIISAILAFGMVSVSLLSFSIIGTGGEDGAGMGMMGAVYGLSSMMSGSGGHLLAGTIGGMLLMVIGFSLPSLIMMQGLCQIYLNTNADLDVEAGWDDMVSRVQAHIPVRQAEEVVRCRHCNEPLEAPDDKFCCHCGKPQQE